MDPAETTTASLLSLSLASPSPPPTLALVGHQQEEDAFPVKVANLPNKGRSYIATRTIHPQELIFVAEAFGTTMCDPWLDCGICHYCWAEIRNRKAQLRLPSASSATVTGEKAKGNGKKQETVMVFCDEVCLGMYGPQVAETVCRVESKIRRTWKDSGAKAWKLKLHPLIETTAVVGPDTPSTSSTPSNGSPHYSELIQQALDTADTKEGILELNDTDLAVFLDATWSAFDGIVSEQESWIQHATTTTATFSSSDNNNNNQHDTLERHSHTQSQCEALYPKLAKLLLEGNNHAMIASKTSDDDCETIRLISEILYRRQLDIRVIAASESTVNGTGVVSLQEAKAPSAEASILLSKEDLVPGGGNGGLRGGQRATFEDYCAMQSNELILVRQQIQEDLDTQDEQNSDLEQERDQEVQDALDQPQLHQHSRQSKHDTNMKQWRKLLSILPNHLLSCFYVYLRLRDAYLLLSRENATTTTTTTTTTMATTPNTPRSQPSQIITLSIDHTLFRTILYREVANSFGIRDTSDELLGFAVFPRASFFNHSCRPNIQKKRRQVLGGRARQMEYWSTELIQEGEECCISYGDISTGVEERRARLEDMYFFRCSCPRCLEEELVVGEELTGKA